MMGRSFMDNQQLRDLSRELLGTLDTVVSDPTRRTESARAIGDALEQEDADALRDALDRDADVQAWVLEHIDSNDRAIGLDGDPLSPPDVVFVCATGHEVVLDSIPLEPPMCFCGHPMSRTNS
jgi:hypothetical protein